MEQTRTVYIHTTTYISLSYLIPSQPGYARGRAESAMVPHPWRCKAPKLGFCLTRRVCRTCRSPRRAGSGRATLETCYEDLIMPHVSWPSSTSGWMPRDQRGNVIGVWMVSLGERPMNSSGTPLNPICTAPCLNPTQSQWAQGAHCWRCGKTETRRG
jgi:hypothetical protein